MEFLWEFHGNRGGRNWRQSREFLEAIWRQSGGNSGIILGTIWRQFRDNVDYLRIMWRLFSQYFEDAAAFAGDMGMMERNETEQQQFPRLSKSGFPKMVIDFIMANRKNDS